MPNDTMNFGVDLLPITTDTYNLGSDQKKWILHGSISGGNNGQVLKSVGGASAWQDEYKVQIIRLNEG